MASKYGGTSSQSFALNYSSSGTTNMSLNDYINENPDDLDRELLYSLDDSNFETLQEVVDSYRDNVIQYYDVDDPEMTKTLRDINETLAKDIRATPNVSSVFYPKDLDEGAELMNKQFQNEEIMRNLSERMAQTSDPHEVMKLANQFDRANRNRLEAANEYYEGSRLDEYGNSKFPNWDGSSVEEMKWALAQMQNPG